MGLVRGCWGEGGIAAAKPVPPRPSPQGLWNSFLPLPLPPVALFLNVCSSFPTRICCYFPFYSPPFPVVSFLPFYWLGGK